MGEKVAGCGQTSLQRVLRNYYTLREAAAVLRVSKVTLWRWLTSGKLHGERVCHEVFLKKVTIDAIKAKAEQATPRAGHKRVRPRPELAPASPSRKEKHERAP